MMTRSREQQTYLVLGLERLQFKPEASNGTLIYSMSLSPFVLRSEKLRELRREVSQEVNIAMS